MPTMIRPKGKGKKVAYSILGEPINMQKSRKKSSIDDKLAFEDTSRVR